MSGVWRLAGFAWIFALSLSGLALVDELSTPPSAAAPPQRSGHASLAPGRVFVLVIDSLRYETAVSAERMPELHALRAQGTFARVTPTRDAVTVPCLRAAFTGRDRTRVFGFVENFVQGSAGIESIFSALDRSKRRATVYSDGAFDQFGTHGISLRSNGDPATDADDQNDHADEQNATLPLALSEYLSGKPDLVVLHVTYTDHVAHEVGVGAPLYKARFRAADALVAALARALPADDTLVVMGDHGHDATGRHAVGLDVPTYALYRGPRFAAGLDLETIAIRDHRYLLSVALGLPLPDDYAGARPLPALRAGAEKLSGYASAGSAVQASPGVPPSATLGYGLGGACLIGLFSAWFVAMSRAVSWRAAGLSALLALSACALGAVFPQVRPLVHEPSYLTIALAWWMLWGVAIALTWRTRRIEGALLVCALPLFFAVPTVYRYGAPAAMAPAWLGLLACTSVLSLATRRALPALGTLSMAGVLLLPFGFAESSGFRFDEWVLWPPSGFLLLSLAAKWIVFAPAQARTPAGRMVAGGAALLLTAAQSNMVPYPLQLIAAAALLAFWMVSRRHLSPERGATAAGLCALLLLHHYSVRVPVEAYYWQDCLLAALVLSARLLGPLPPPARTVAHAVLLLLAFFASGWVSFAWTLHRLEWGFLYDFWPAAFVERHVVMFLPILMGRFALPLLAARVLLRRELSPGPEPDRSARTLAWLLIGSKVASLMFWSYGTAFVSVASDVYLEAVQETSLACVLLLGLL